MICIAELYNKGRGKIIRWLDVQPWSKEWTGTQLLGFSKLFLFMTKLYFHFTHCAVFCLVLLP